MGKKLTLLFLLTSLLILGFGNRSYAAWDYYLCTVLQTGINTNGTATVLLEEENGLFTEWYRLPWGNSGLAIALTAVAVGKKVRVRLQPGTWDSIMKIYLYNEIAGASSNMMYREYYNEDFDEEVNN